MAARLHANASKNSRTLRLAFGSSQHRPLDAKTLSCSVADAFCNVLLEHFATGGATGDGCLIGVVSQFGSERCTCRAAGEEHQLKFGP